MMSVAVDITVRGKIVNPVAIDIARRQPHLLIMLLESLIITKLSVCGNVELPLIQD